MAISASATARPPSLTSCTPVSDPSRTSVDQVVHGPGAVEVGGRRHPAVETVHDRGPLRTAELGRISPSTTMSSPARSCAAGGLAQLVDQPEHAATGVGWMSSSPDAL